jgi:Family of unknown function (DUF5317)
LIIVFACLVVIALEAVFLRGRLKKLAGLRFRRIYLVWLALLDQVLVISILPGGHHLVLDIANLLSYLAAAAFVWSNRRIPGFLLLAAGGALNLVAIGANGGTMPASASALAASGWHPAPGHFVNSGVVTHPKLSFLGDIFATPHWMPFHDVFSVGDIVIVLAVAILVWRTCTKSVESVDGASNASEAGHADRSVADIGVTPFTPAAG